MNHPITQQRFQPRRFRLSTSQLHFTILRLNKTSGMKAEGRGHETHTMQNSNLVSQDKFRLSAPPYPSQTRRTLREEARAAGLFRPSPAFYVAMLAHVLLLEARSPYARGRAHRSRDGLLSSHLPFLWRLCCTCLFPGSAAFSMPFRSRTFICAGIFMATNLGRDFKGTVQLYL